MSNGRIQYERKAARMLMPKHICMEAINSYYKKKTCFFKGDRKGTRMKLCSNPPKWMTRLIVWKVCQDGIQLYKGLENLWGIAGMKTVNEHPIRWRLLQPRVKPTKLLSCRLLWGRNLLSRQLGFPGIAQKTRLLFQLQTYLLNWIVLHLFQLLLLISWVTF